MGIRGLLVTLFVVVLIVAFAAIFGLMAFMQARIYELFPPELQSQAYATLKLLITQEIIALFVLSLVLMTVMFVTLSHFIVRPLKSIIAGMSAFAETGEKSEMPDVRSAPKEIRQLGEVFQDFVDRVDQVHKHDVEVSRVKSDFISTAAHQLRTPLTGIRWALEALEKEDLTESQKALVKSAKDKSHDLVDTVGTLLDISSIESGKYKYKFEATDISALIAEVAQDFAPMAGQAKVSLFYAKTEQEVPNVRVDQNRIKWILNNLIENAIRYTPPGGTVRVSADAGGGRLNIRVHDTGIGIAANDRANIFERFYRAPNAITKENQGNGLGLYIARTIAADHGGDLNFFPNSEGPGTTFVLSLPLAG